MATALVYRSQIYKRPTVGLIKIVTHLCEKQSVTFPTFSPLTNASSASACVVVYCPLRTTISILNKLRKNTANSPCLWEANTLSYVTCCRINDKIAHFKIPRVVICTTFCWVALSVIGSNRLRPPTSWILAPYGICSGTLLPLSTTFCTLLY